MDFLNRPASNYATAAWLCGLIRCLRLPDPLSRCIDYVAEELGPTARYFIRGTFTSCPAWFAARFEDRILVVVDGATTLAQLEGLVAGYTGTLIGGFGDPDNVYLQAAADSIVRDLMAQGMADTQKWTLAGFSLGGAIVTLIPANEAIKPWNENFIDAVSFGAPRPGGTSVSRYINSRMSLTRYMNDTDPIPLTPPRIELMPSLPLIIGVRPSLRWANFVQPSGGIQLDEAGHPTARALPESGVIQFPMSLAAWMFGLESVLTNTHAIQVYANRLLIAADRQRNHSLPPRVPAERAAANTVREATRQERQAEQTVINLERRQNEAPLVIPKVERAKVVKIGSMWFVTFRGTPVMSGRNKRKAYGVKNDLNRMLERLQTAAMVDTVHFGAEFQRYLDDAADPAGEFSPVMSTDWNAGNI